MPFTMANKTFFSALRPIIFKLRKSTLFFFRSIFVHYFVENFYDVFADKGDDDVEEIFNVVVGIPLLDQ